MSSRLKVAVIGVGSLGKEHARIYAALAQTGAVELVGVFDVQADSAAAVANKLGTRAFATVAEAANAADALSIVTPTSTHFTIARDLLARGKHLLVEKPMTETGAGRSEERRVGKECVP